MNQFQLRCEEYIYCSIAYYEFDHSFCADEVYDNICKTLASSWKSLPSSFKERVLLSDLIAGTGFCFKPFDEERKAVKDMILGLMPPPNLVSQELYNKYLLRLSS